MTTKTLQHDGSVAFTSGRVLPPSNAQIPSAAVPREVENARAEHETIVSDYREAQEAVKQLEDDLKRAHADDLRDDAELVAAGKKPLAPGKRTAPKVEDELTEAKRRLHVLAKAGEIAYQALAEAVREHTAAWLEELSEQQTEAEGEYGEALKRLRQAANKLVLTRGATAWLDADEGRGPLPNRTASDKLTVNIGSGIARKDEPAARLIQALGSVVEPEERRSERGHSAYPRMVGQKAAA